MRQVPRRVRQLCGAGKLILSAKAQVRLIESRFSLDDLISSIVHGRLVKVQRDESRVSRLKYVIVGPSVSGRPVYSCGKVVAFRKGQNYYVITAHEAD